MHAPSSQRFSVFLTSASVLIGALLFTGCSGSGSGGSPASTSVLSLGSFPGNGTTVHCARMTFELTGPEGESFDVTSMGQVVAEGVFPVGSGTFLVHNVPLAVGQNTIAFRTPAGAVNGDSISRNVVVAGPLVDPVRYSPSPSFVHSPETSTGLVLDLRGDADPAAGYLLDFEGDGIAEQSQTSVIDTVVLPGVGTYKPTIAIRNSSGYLFSNLPEHTERISVLEEAAFDPSLELAVGDVVDGLIAVGESGELWVLSSGSGTIRTFDRAGQLIRTLDIYSAVGAGSMHLAGNGDLYVADVQGHQVFRFLEASGYQPDTSLSSIGAFGVYGSGAGEFSSPSSCSASTTLPH